MIINEHVRTGEVQAVEAQEQKSELQLFEEFYELLNNEPMKEEQTEFVEKTDPGSEGGARMKPLKRHYLHLIHMRMRL